MCEINTNLIVTYKHISGNNCSKEENKVPGETIRELWPGLGMSGEADIEEIESELRLEVNWRQEKEGMGLYVGVRA